MWTRTCPRHTGWPSKEVGQDAPGVAVVEGGERGAGMEVARLQQLHVTHDKYVCVA
jgi:hypothetical protein